jgi:peptidyl-prolyl cis-trans isomerase SurA
MVPEFSTVAFNMTDPNKISKIVETEYGYHIIQFVERLGDRVRVRHILRKPRIPMQSVNDCLARLDTIADNIRNGNHTFEFCVAAYSQDKDTRNNNGLMANVTQEGRTSRFKLADLPPEVAKAIDPLKVGEISAPFLMTNERGKTVCVIAKLKSRTEGHKAIITDDFQVMKNVVLEKRRSAVIHDWVVKRIKSTYVRLNERYRDCDFEYEGWVR